MTEKTLTKIETEVSPVAHRATLITIKTQEDVAEATTLLSTLNSFMKRVQEEKEKVTKPLNEALRAERLRWKPIESLHEGAIALLRSKLSQYATMEARRVKEEEAKLASRIGDGKGKIKMETAVRKMSEIERPEARVETKAGALTFRTDKKLSIVNANLIPREYLIPDERAILTALKAGKTVAGCELEEVKVAINKI